MASGTSMVPFADAEIKMRWREPYVTEGLNKKLAGVVPRGIYRGFRLGENGAPMLLEVLADTVKGDHVAVYETDTAVAERYSLRVELVGGDFTLDLTAWPSQLVYIAIYAEYSTLGTTSASLRVYTEAEYAGAVEKDELIVLGTVNVPALGNPIPAADINEDFRTFPWDNQAPDARDWNPILRNGGFDAGPTVAALPKGMIPFWTHYPDSSNTNMVFGTTTADKRSGVQSLLLGVLATVATSISLGYGDLTAVTEGQRFKWRLSYKPVQTLSAGTLQFQIQYLDDDVSGYALSTVVLHTLDTSVTGSWIDAEGSGVVPAGVKYIYSISIATAAGPTPNFPATGDAIFFDQLQVWLEPDLGDGSNPEDKVRRQKLDVQRIDFTSTVVQTSGGDAALINGGTGPELRRRDQDGDASAQPKILSAGGLESGSALITPSSGATFEAKTSGVARYQGEVRDSAVAPNLMTYWKVGGVNPSMYEYACPTLFGRFLTYNSYWHSAVSEWRCNLTGSDATAIQQSSGGVTIAWHPATAGTWAHGAWTPLLTVNASLGYIVGYVPFTDGALNKLAPFIYAPNSADNLKLWSQIGVQNATAEFARGYTQASDDSVAWVVNAHRDAGDTTWEPDDAASHAVMMKLVGDSAGGATVVGPKLVLAAQPTPTGASFASFTKLLGLGFGKKTGVAEYGAYLEVPGNDTSLWAPDDFPQHWNRLYNRNLIKAWLKLTGTTDGAGGWSVGPTIKGYNIDSVTIGSTPAVDQGRFSVTLSVGFAGVTGVLAIANNEHVAGDTYSIQKTANATVTGASEIQITCHAAGAFTNFATGSYAVSLSMILLGY